MVKYFTSAISILGLAFVISGCNRSGGGGGGDVVATVNGERITKDEYISYLEHKLQVMVQTPQGPMNLQVATPLDFQALNDIVSQRLLVQLAKEENVLPTEAEVNAELQLRTTMRPDFVRSLTDLGYSLTGIKNELMVSLCRHKILSKGVTITSAQVDAYIKANPQKFMSPRTVDMSWIVVGNAADKAKVDSDLKTGQTFTVVAKQYSTISNPMYPKREYDQFTPPLKKVVDKMGDNGTSDWIQEGNKFIKFHVEKNTPASKIEIKDWMKTQIQRELADQKGAAAQDLDKKLMEMRKQAKIDVQPAGLKQKFDTLNRQMKESEMKNSASTSATDTKPAASNAPAPVSNEAKN